MKKGITITALLITIAILSIIIGTITFSTKNVYDNSIKISFATEISMLQEAVNSYYAINNEIPKDNMVSLDLSNVNANYINQFDDETILSNIVQLYEIDYSLINISDLEFKSTDYLISEDTNKVYYKSGLMISNKIYYTITEDLGDLINYNIEPINIEYEDGIVVIPSISKYTNSDISLVVKVPTEYAAVSVTSTVGSVGASVLEGNYNKYDISNVDANGQVTINYTKDSVSSSIVYYIDNIDKVAPSITIDSTQMLLESDDSIDAYIKINSKSDDYSGIKWVKYTNSDIDVSNISNYFTNGGIVVNSDIIPIKSDITDITLVICDNAGNMSYLKETIDSNIQTSLYNFYNATTVANQYNQVNINEITTENSTVTGTIPTYDNPVIPKGFKAVNAVNASWVDVESDYTNGLVIEDINANQFVWVPVDGTNVTYTKDLTYNWIQSDLTDGTLPSGINSEQTQIDTYGGFYIARYEAGKEGTDTLVSKTAQNAWVSITHTDAKTTAESMYTTSDYNVKSGLITGTMWDATMDFVTNSGYNVLDSRAWGNCSNPVSPANVSGYGNVQVTGYSEYWKANNIYNLAGNVREWTNEIYDTSRVMRGGNIYSSGLVHDASYRDGDVPNSSYSNRGFRVCLYVVEKEYSQIECNTIVTVNSTINGNNPSYNNPVIPIGFKAINATNNSGSVVADWTSLSTDWNKGLVIEDILR